MAISRFMSQSSHQASLRPLAARINHIRHRSSKTHNAQLLEVDLDGGSSLHPDSAEAGAEVIAGGIRKLEDAIQSIIVRRAAPDWLPFLPGYSYWVPPRASEGMVQVIANMNSVRAMKNRRFTNELSEDEQMSLSSTKGWPSSAFFIEGTSPIHPLPIVKVEVNIEYDEDSADEASSSQDTGE